MGNKNLDTIISELTKILNRNIVVLEREQLIPTSLHGEAFEEACNTFVKAARIGVFKEVIESEKSRLIQLEFEQRDKKYYKIKAKMALVKDTNQLHHDLLTLYWGLLKQNGEEVNQ